MREGEKGMNEILRRDAEQIIQASLRAVQPDAAVRRALGRYRSQGGQIGRAHV